MGYIERSYGIFQALIEYTFFNPKSPFPKSKLLSFQDFWERKSCIKTGEIDLFNGWEDRFYPFLFLFLNKVFF